MIANNLAIVADDIFSAEANLLPAAFAWLGLVCYSLQIYFDFSGYSDMAIGLARMFGFRFPKNFNYPYTSRSIREFWRRWHISLSTWFRDYFYKPLGGDRLSGVRTYTNLVTVFLLCGLWHGASWNFALWGLFHGGFLCLERTRFRTLIGSLSKYLQHAYTMIVVMAGWVFFRCSTFSEAKMFFLSLSGCFAGDERYHLSHYANPDTLFWILIGMIAATPFPKHLSKESKKRLTSIPRIGEMISVLGSGTMLVSLFILSVSFLLAGSYNPFIYFRF